MNSEDATRSDTDIPLVRQVAEVSADGSHRCLLLFVMLVVIYLPTANYTAPMINDNISMAAAAWNLGTNGALEFTEQGIEGVPWGVVLEDGRVYSNRFPGTFVAASVVYRLLPIESFRPPGNEGVPLWPGTLAAVLFAAAAIVVLVEVLRRVLPPRLALSVGLVVALATPFWSIAANELWTHGPAVLFLGLGVLALAHERYGWAGAALGYAVLIRPTLAVVPLVVGLGAGLAKRSIRPVAWIGTLSLLGLGALSVYSHVLFDTWMPVAGYTPSRGLAAIGARPTSFGGFTLWEQLFGSLFDTYRGVLIFSPFLVWVVPAVRSGWRAAPWWVRAAAVAGIAAWVVQLRANGFPGGMGFWGYRLAIEPLILMAPLFAVAYDQRIRHVRLWRFATQLTIVGAFAIILPGAVWFGSKPEPPRPQYVPIDHATTQEAGRIPDALRMPFSGRGDRWSAADP